MAFGCTDLCLVARAPVALRVPRPATFEGPSARAPPSTLRSMLPHPPELLPPLLLREPELRDRPVPPVAVAAALVRQAVTVPAREVPRPRRQEQLVDAAVALNAGLHDPAHEPPAPGAIPRQRGRLQ